VDESARLSGLDGLREVVATLDGFELAAGAWERAILPSRMDRYDPAMLDMLCLAGEVGWARLSPPRTLQLSRGTPVALFLREHADAWQALRSAPEPPLETAITSDAGVVLERLRRRGASFFNELAAGLHFDPARLRDAIGVLVAAGLAASDGFSGLRALVAAAQEHAAPQGRRSNFAGRWTALPALHDGTGREAAVERQARTLLKRYGVVFRRILTREPNAAPWRELSRVYRTLEARGEIRGGRFVSGMAGEQYALSDAIPVLREVRRTAPDGRLSVICTADPLNLAGIVTAGERVRAAGRNHMAYRDGVPVAVMEGAELRPLLPLDARETILLVRTLGRRRAAAHA
jgi:ATP-dependent Lhr-like helicase